MDNKIETISNLFEGKEIRSHWNSENEEYYFSVVDVIDALTDSKIPKRYWSDLKIKLADEGSEVYEKIVRLKLKAKEAKEAKEARDVHYEVGKKVRKAIADIGGMMPEEMPTPKKSLKEKRNY